MEFNLRELYRRVAFNVCVGNSDDHFRNHGFLLTRRGWTLAPAFDMNPTANEYQSILITASSNRAELSLLLEAAEDYMLVPSEARSIIEGVVDVVDVVDAVKDWRILALKLGIVQRECQLFEHRLDTRVL